MSTPPVPSSKDPVPSKAGGDRLLDLLRIMHRLRSPGGCPWDAEQNHRSLGRHLLEEAHEALEAIESGDSERLCDELGDLLLQVVFHAEMAMQEGTFDVDDVAEGITAKLVRRHPHVFGEAKVGSAAEVQHNWERIKSEERGGSALDEMIPATLPALARAAKVQRRAAGFGFEWSSRALAMRAVREELAELERAASGEEVEEEVGDLLFAVAAVARLAGVDPESALRRSIRGFSGRFERMRAAATQDGVDLAGLSDEELAARFDAARTP